MTSRCDVPARVRAGGTNRAPRANPAARCAARRGADGAARHPYLGRRATGSRVSSRPPPVPEGRPRIARRFNAGSEAGRTQVPTGTTEKAILPRKPCLRRPVNPHSAFSNRWALQFGRVSVLANPNFSRTPHLNGSATHYGPVTYQTPHGEKSEHASASSILRWQRGVVVVSGLREAQIERSSRVRSPFAVPLEVGGAPQI